ncbi:membrane-associated protein [Agrobacterium sp. a22-2]|uniref:DedA family protein n=1 Tax=Agrobacterium sp. a22-2 TaxID=2283840 RepID=UPI001447E198|nr:membrane-associated protein [Agrobacterium sp. a22-2]NKN37306.1 membrane-associated protein [Agrobacterium sp. a22-2]
MGLDPVAEIIVWVSGFGLLGLFVAALSERLIPILPSHGLYLAIGVGAAEGAWSLAGAWLVTSVGSAVGLAATFCIVTSLGYQRMMRLLRRISQLLRIAPARTDNCLATLSQHRIALAFSFQLVPTLRLVAPALGALMRDRPYGFLTASMAGIAVWNGLFLAIGYYVSEAAVATNTTFLALLVLGFMLIAEAVIVWFTRLLRQHRKFTTVIGASGS